MATAVLAEDSRDVGVGDTLQEAVRGALKALGEPYASAMAKGGCVSTTTRLGSSRTALHSLASSSLSSSAGEQPMLWLRSFAHRSPPSKVVSRCEPLAIWDSHPARSLNPCRR